MILEITRHKLRINSTDQPMDDIFAEEVLGLCTKGDYVKLVRVSNKHVSQYVLETELVVTNDNIEKAEEVVGSNLSEATLEPTPLPCPFCGKYPKIHLQAESVGGAWGKIVCDNPLCLVKPEIYDNRRVTDFEDPRDWKNVIISMWNERAK